MITLFCGHHVGVPQRYTNMAAPYLWKISQYDSVHLRRLVHLMQVSFCSLLRLIMQQINNFCFLIVVIMVLD